MKDTGRVDNKEEQDASVDNTCYMKLSCKLTYWFTLLQLLLLMFSEQYYCMASPILMNFGTFRLIPLSSILVI